MVASYFNRDTSDTHQLSFAMREIRLLVIEQVQIRRVLDHLVIKLRHKAVQQQEE